MKRLDINKDGKISFDEFRYWWVNGFKGKLGKLVYLKAKSEKIGKNILKHLRETGTNMDSSTNSN
jgi:Ca2+-binding EF-hand superfamily protein